MGVLKAVDAPQIGRMERPPKLRRFALLRRSRHTEDMRASELNAGRYSEEIFDIAADWQSQFAEINLRSFDVDAERSREGA